MFSPKLASLAIVLLAGCGSGEEAARDNFGDDMVAGFFVKAQSMCAAEGQPSIAVCAEAFPPLNEARVAALVAQNAYKTFQIACYPELGMSKCEALVEQAYQEAKSR
jgi:hypothetical protein